jgi:hypothetical protein
MSVLSDSSGKKAKISILKTHPLTYAPGLRRTPGERVPSPMPSPRRSVPTSLIPSELVSREPSPAQTRPVTPPAIDLAKFKFWAEEAMSNQQKDIDRLSGTVERLERDMRSFKEFMVETRAELSSSSRIPLIVDNNEMRSLRDELEELRQKVDQNGGLMTRGSLDIARSVDVVVQDVQRISQKTDEFDLLKTQLTEMQSQIHSLEAAQKSMTVYNQETGRTLLSGLDKRKYGNDDQEYTIEEGQRMDGTLAKRRRVSGATSPSASIPNDRLTLDAGHDRYHTPAPEITEIPSSSGINLSPDLFVQQGDFGTSDFGQENLSNIPDVPSSIATSNNRREQGAKSSTVRVEINSFLKPSMMMPLQNGTIFNAGSRNDLLDISHIEAATGHKRDQHGRWISAQDQRPQLSVRRQDGKNPRLNAVFANSLIGNSNVNEQDQERRRTLRPRKEQPTTGFETYDGPGDETWTPNNDDNGEEEAEDREGDHQNNDRENDAETARQSSDTKKKSTVTMKTNYAGFSSLSALSRAERENTVPPIEWPGAIEASDKLTLPQFYKCGTCNKPYRTLQALDYVSTLTLLVLQDC